MPINVPGILVPFQLIFKPRLALPSLAVPDIRSMDFARLRKAGYRGAVFDKDNCLTIPHKDTLVPELESAWRDCRRVFGEGNVIIVSNSAGTYLDAGEIQAESVSHHLGVPVLVHNKFKPSYSCIEQIRGYFSALQEPIQDKELVIVGDRIFTDVIMANRMKQREGGSEVGPLSIWTTGVWKRESMVMRWLEKGLVNAVESMSRQWASRNGKVEESLSQPYSDFIRS